MSDTTHAQAYLDRLVAALEDRGLETAAKLPALTVRNPAARVDALSPGLVQQLLIRNLDGLGLTWCWVWPGLRGAERGAPKPAPTVEPMCPAEDIGEAARRIAVVLSVRDGDVPLESSHG